MKKLFKRIGGSTPIKDELKGQFCTKLGMACGGLLTMVGAGTIILPVGAVVALVFGAVVFTGKAVYHAQKTE
jgi:hypothetical protein